MECTAYAHWNVNLIPAQSSTLSQTPYLFKTRFGLGIGTNTEEFIAVKHAGFTANELNTEVGIAEIRSLVFHWI